MLSDKPLEEELTTISCGSEDYYPTVKNPEDQYDLAMGLAKTNPEAAKSLIHKSAIQGHPKALKKLSAAYLVAPELFNVTQNMLLSKRITQELANMGDRQAQYDIAAAYLFGTYGVRKPIHEAIQVIRELKDNCHATELLEYVDGMSASELEEFVRG